MLFLIGMGLTNREIPFTALDDLTSADEVLLDPYTNFIPEEDLAYLSHNFNIEITSLTRSDLEENSRQIVERAKGKNVAILVSGDPLIATTHHTILDLAAKLGIDYKIYHSSNIFSAAIGESGLDIYKLGPTTTIAFWTDKYKPVSFIDVIKRNVDSEQHTIVLFDYNYLEKRKMRLGEAIPVLHAADEQRKHNIMSPSRKLLILGDIGKKSQSILYTEFGKINKDVLKEFEGKIITMIVPGAMSFAEEDAIAKFSGIKPAST
ncbi:MAG: diphthine synthase [Candidatus Micrarchaeota archaeon]|nr:diphthine synthase [Candidatus Micrarchaeota archaeon]